MGLYWNTLRQHKKNFTDEGKKVKNYWFTKGISMAAILTGRCNLHCSYCPMFLTDDKYPYGKQQECTLEEWKEYFERFPEWISQIFLTGGEPTILPWISDLINFLTDRGHHVILFSNLLKPENLYGVKKTFKFVLIPTFHQNDDDPERFKAAVKKLKENTKFRIMAQEMEKKHKLSFTIHKEKFRDEWWYNENYLIHVAPDAPKTGKLYFGCHRAYLDGKK